MAANPPRTAGWDPVLFISQIIGMQSLHYLTLAIVTPILLTTFTNKELLKQDGGAASVGMVVDWREMAGRSTAGAGDLWHPWKGAWRSGERLGSSSQSDLVTGHIEPLRGWIISACWLMACSLDVYLLYYLIRRPRLILDFSLTLLFNHLVITTYYSAAFPTSLFFWTVCLAGAAITVIFAEQLCVKREMKEGLVSSSWPNANGDVDLANNMEMGSLRPD